MNITGHCNLDQVLLALQAIDAKSCITREAHTTSDLQ